MKEWNREQRQWIEETYEKLVAKVAKTSARVGDWIPYIAQDGAYTEDMGSREIEWWTNGFWAGLLWQMYHATGDAKYMEQARITEERLDKALEDFEGLYHDVGFMWMHSAVADYRLTGEGKARARGHHAANILAGRYNPNGRFLRAWNGDLAGWVIVDCLMNLSILYWASEEIKDPRFAAIAKIHADTTLEKVLRPDGSSNHILIFDPENGELLEKPGGQGYESGSSWSRGQSWALYGMTISYVHTGEERYLQAAMRTADYFIQSVEETDYLPRCDFRQPAEPVIYDSTAGACAACGLLELAKYVTEEKAEFYRDSAIKILMAMDREFCNWKEEEDGILYYGRVAYHQEDGDNSGVSIIYGDYFYTEAILRLMEKDFFIW